MNLILKSTREHSSLAIRADQRISFAQEGMIQINYLIGKIS
jgi:hypothetical protein